jgi:phosphorylcholine metabolism protein LicD
MVAIAVFLAFQQFHETIGVHFISVPTDTNETLGGQLAPPLTNGPPSIPLVVPNYPSSIAEYTHPTRACNGTRRTEVTLKQTLWLNQSRVWPTIPDARLEGKSELERCHRVMLRQLVVLSVVMNALNLTSHWFISHATLLGAVRHGGFIPWDVDIDVVMPRGYITKLRQEWRNYFPRDMFLQTEKTEPSFHMWVGKERGVRIKDRYSSFEGMKFTFWSRGKKYKQKKWHLGAHVDIIPLQRMGQGKFKLLHHYMNYSMLFPTKPICFEDLMVPAPADVDGVLREFYGPDYMSLPPNVTFGGPTVLPCKATSYSSGSAWSLSWENDFQNGSLVTVPRGDPWGSPWEDRRFPYP